MVKAPLSRTNSTALPNSFWIRRAYHANGAPSELVMRLLPRWSRRNCASTCPDYCRRNAIFHRRACIGQISILAI